MNTIYTPEKLIALAKASKITRTITDLEGNTIDLKIEFFYDHALATFNRVGFFALTTNKPLGDKIASCIDVRNDKFIDPNQMLNYIENRIIHKALEAIYGIEYV